MLPGVWSAAEWPERCLPRASWSLHRRIDLAGKGLYRPQLLRRQLASEQSARDLLSSCDERLTEALAQAGEVILMASGGVWPMSVHRPSPSRSSTTTGMTRLVRR